MGEAKRRGMKKDRIEGAKKRKAAIDKIVAILSAQRESGTPLSEADIELLKQLSKETQGTVVITTRKPTSVQNLQEGGMETPNGKTPNAS